MTTNSFRVSAEASGDVLSDSGIGDTTKAEATGRHGKQQFLPHGGEAAATKPPGFWVSQTVVVVEEEQDDCENDVPALESLTLLADAFSGPAGRSDETLPMLSPEEEVDVPSSAEMIWLERKWSTRDMKTKFSENVTQLWLEYEAVIMNKNAEIRKLKDELEKLKNELEERKMQISNLEKTKEEERGKQTEQLQKKNCIEEEDYESEKTKSEDIIMQLSGRICQMEAQVDYLNSELAEAKRRNI